MDFAAVLDTRTGRWRDLPPLPHARYAHTVTAFDGSFYVIGGRDVDGEIAAVDVFDPRTETWTTLDRPMPRARVRDSHKTVAAPEGLVVAGGQRDFQDSDLVDLFDPRTGRWTTLPDLPEPMSRAGLAYADGKLWISLHESAYVMDATKLEDLGARQRADALAARHGVRRPRRLPLLDRRLCAEPVAGRAHRRPDEASLTGRAAMRIDVVSIFPGYLAPLELSLAGQGARVGAARPARPRPARLDPRPAPHHRRHSLRRRRRDGHEAGAVGRGARRAADRRGDPGRPDPGGGPVRPGRGPRARRPRPAGPRLRSLRGDRPAGGRPLRRGVRRAGGVDRRLRAQRGRGGGAGHHRGGDPARPRASWATPSR